MPPSRYQPYPDTRDSGVEWLGEIPSHWKVMALKRATNINMETLPETTDPDYELQYIDIGNVDSLGKVHEIQDFVFEKAPSRARRIVRHGDTIVSTVRTYLKAVAYIR
jgi:type I restriction enzyme S subunit